MADKPPENAGKLDAMSSLEIIDARIHSKIGLLESLLGSCDGVLRRHDEDEARGSINREANAKRSNQIAAGAHQDTVDISPSHRHPGNPVLPVAPDARKFQVAGLFEKEPAREKVQESRQHRSPQRPIPVIVTRMLEASRLMRAQRVLYRVTRQLCRANHLHCCNSLRIHRFAERQIRLTAVTEMGRDEVVRGVRLQNWMEETMLIQAFLGWHLMVVHMQGALQFRQRNLLIANVDMHCLLSLALRAWQRTAQDSLVACAKVMRLRTFLMLKKAILRWRKFRSYCAVMIHRQARIEEARCRSIMHSWNCIVKVRAAEFRRRNCHVVISSLFLRGMIRSVFNSWRWLQNISEKRRRCSAVVSMRCRGRVTRITFHCWYAVRQENKWSAQKWWLENKIETLFKTIEGHEQTSSQKDRTMKEYLETSGRLEGEIMELQQKVDLQRSIHAEVRIECSRFIRMLSFAIWSLYGSIRMQCSAPRHGTSQRLFPMSLTQISEAETQETQISETQLTISLFGTHLDSSIVGCVADGFVGESVGNKAQPDSASAALTSVIFSLWSCVLAPCQVRKLRCADVRRKFAKSSIARILVSWSRSVKRVHMLFRNAKMILRRARISLLRRFIRLWSGTYFTFSAYLKIRNCRIKCLFRRIIYTKIDYYWSIWRLVCGSARYHAVALQRCARKNRKQLLLNVCSQWYLLAKVQRQQVVCDSVCLDASQARGNDAEVRDAGQCALSGGLQHFFRAVHLLIAKEKELRDIRRQLYIRDESFGRLSSALAGSQSELASIKERLSMKMSDSDLNENIALDHVHSLALQNQIAEQNMEELKCSVSQLTAAGQTLQIVLGNVRYQAAEYCRELEGCKMDLAEAQKAIEEQTTPTNAAHEVATMKMRMEKNGLQPRFETTLQQNHSGASSTPVKGSRNHAESHLHADCVELPRSLDTVAEICNVCKGSLTGSTEDGLEVEQLAQLKVLHAPQLADLRGKLAITQRELLKAQEDLAHNLQELADSQSEVEHLSLLKSQHADRILDLESKLSSAEQELCQTKKQDDSLTHLKVLANSQHEIEMLTQEIEVNRHQEQILEAKVRDEALQATLAEQGVLGGAHKLKENAFLVQRGVHGLANEMKEKAALFEARVLAAEESCKKHVQALEDMQSESQMWQSKAKEYLLGKEAAERAVQDLFDEIDSYQRLLESKEVEVQQWKSRTEEYLAGKEDAEAKTKGEMRKAKDNRRLAIQCQDEAAQETLMNAEMDALNARCDQAFHAKERAQADAGETRADLQRSSSSSSFFSFSSTSSSLSEEMREKDKALVGKEKQAAKIEELEKELMQVLQRRQELFDEIDRHVQALEKMQSESQMWQSKAKEYLLGKEAAERAVQELCIAEKSNQRLLESKEVEVELWKSRAEEVLANSQHEIEMLTQEIEVNRHQEQILEAKVRDEALQATLAEQGVLGGAHKLKENAFLVQRGVHGLANEMKEKAALFEARVLAAEESCKKHVQALEDMQSESQMWQSKAKEYLLGKEAAERAVQDLFDEIDSYQRLLESKEVEVQQWKSRTEEYLAGKEDAEAKTKGEMRKAKDNRRLAIQCQDEAAQETLMNAEMDALNARCDQAFHAKERAQADAGETRADLQRLSEEMREKDKALVGKEKQAAKIEELEKELMQVLQRRQELFDEIDRLKARAREVEETAAYQHKQCEKMMQAFRSETESIRSQLAKVEQDAIRARHDRDQAILGEERASAELKRLYDACSHIVHAEAGVQDLRAKAVDMIITLSLNFTVAGEDGSKGRKLFENSLKKDLADASGLPEECFIVCRLSSGSIIVEMQVHPHPSGGPVNLLDVVRDLEAQAEDADSQLMTGILSRYTKSICLPKQSSLQAVEGAPSRKEDLDELCRQQRTLLTSAAIERHALKDEVKDAKRLLTNKTEEIIKFQCDLQTATADLESRLTSIQKKLSKTQEDLAAYSKELADRQIEVDKLTLLKVQHEDQIVELASKLASKEQALLGMSAGVANSETRPAIVSFITSTHQTQFSRRQARPCVDADLSIKDEREVNVSPVASQGSEDDTPRVTGVMQVTDAEVQAGAMQWEVKDDGVQCALQLQSVQELADREREVESLSLLKAQHEARIADLEGKLDSTQQGLLKMEDSLAIRSQELADIRCEVELLSLHKEQYEVQIAGLETVQQSCANWQKSALGARAEADELRKELEKTKEVAGNQESLVQERDAALDRANAAEEQIKMWVEKSETLERTWEEWRCRVDEMQQHKEQDQRELSKMKNQEALIPVAVALTIEADYDELLADVDSAVDFNFSLQTDVQLALGVAKSSVQVLCHRRGSIIAEIVLRRSDDGQGNSFTPQQLATQLQALVAMQDGPLQQLPVGKRVKTVEIHGPIPEALVLAVSSAMQDALELNLRANMKAHLSLENKSNALQTALHDVEELMDILISQKSYAEALSDPSLLQDEAISWLDVNHRQFLAQLHYDAEQLGESFFTAISELEKVVERLQSLLYHRMAHRTSTAAQSPVIAFLPASVRVKAASTTNSDASVHRQHTSSSLENLEELELELELELLKCRQDIADLFDRNIKNKIKQDLRQSQHMPEAEDQITPMDCVLESAHPYKCATLEDQYRDSGLISAFVQFSRRQGGACSTLTDQALDSGLISSFIQFSSRQGRVDVDLSIKDEREVNVSPVAQRSEDDAKQVMDAEVQAGVMLWEVKDEEVQCAWQLQSAQEDLDAGVRYSWRALGLDLADREREVENLALLKAQHEVRIADLEGKLAIAEEELCIMQQDWDARSKDLADAMARLQDPLLGNVEKLQPDMLQVTDAEVQAGAMQWEVKDDGVQCALQLQSVQELADREREVESLSLLKAQHEARIADLEGKLDSTQQGLLKMEDSLAIRSQELADIRCEVELLSLHKEQYEVQIAGLDTVQQSCANWQKSALGARAEADELRKELEKTKEVAGNQESLVQERDAALDRANAAEEQIKMWVEKSETLERTWEEWRCRVDEMQQHKEQDQRELSKMKNQEALIPVAVALTIEADYDELLADVDSAVDFNFSLQTDVQLALGVAKSSVQVLCHRRGSIIAEIVLRRSDDGQGNSFTPQQLATQLQALVAMQDGPLQQLPVGKRVKTVEIHGPIPEALVLAVSSAMQDALELNLRANKEAAAQDAVVAPGNQLLYPFSGSRANFGAGLFEMSYTALLEDQVEQQAKTNNALHAELDILTDAANAMATDMEHAIHLATHLDDSIYKIFTTSAMTLTFEAAHLSLAKKRHALQTSLSDPSLLQVETISWLDVNHRQFLSQLHYDTEQLGDSLSTAVSELEKVVERLQSLLYHRMAHRTNTTAQCQVIAFLPAPEQVRKEKDDTSTMSTAAVPCSTPNSAMDRALETAYEEKCAALEGRTCALQQTFADWQENALAARAEVDKSRECSCMYCEASTKLRVRSEDPEKTTNTTLPDASLTDQSNALQTSLPAFDETLRWLDVNNRQFLAKLQCDAEQLGDSFSTAISELDKQVGRLQLQLYHRMANGTSTATQSPLIAFLPAPEQVRKEKDDTSTMSTAAVSCSAPNSAMDRASETAYEEKCAALEGRTCALQQTFADWQENALAARAEVDKSKEDPEKTTNTTLQDASLADQSNALHTSLQAFENHFLMSQRGSFSTEEAQQAHTELQKLKKRLQVFEEALCEVFSAHVEALKEAQMEERMVQASQVDKLLLKLSAVEEQRNSLLSATKVGMEEVKEVRRQLAQVMGQADAKQKELVDHHIEKKSEVQNEETRMQVVLYGVLEHRRDSHIKRKCLCVLGSWVGRQECIRKISAGILKNFYEHLLLEHFVRWCNLKRRQQLRRVMASKKLQDATTQVRMMRLVADSFRWWCITSVGTGWAAPAFAGEGASSPLWFGANRTTLPKSSSQNIFTPRESLGAVASASAMALTPRRNLGETRPASFSERMYYEALLKISEV